ncbi:hypothetical protein Pan14r_45100 [Crateriforma conspicua]|uniref:Uncharacterized protein n=1 Tax=Crateriforma conspicua TaxID=2527996 RepID=A0A5C5YG64_9PLAN|nr:hypothetical protein Pan14r_45100 [Crateriforma conspicua]
MNFEVDLAGNGFNNGHDRRRRSFRCGSLCNGLLGEFLYSTGARPRPVSGLQSSGRIAPRSESPVSPHRIFAT